MVGPGGGWMGKRGKKVKFKKIGAQRNGERADLCSLFIEFRCSGVGPN